MNKKVVYVSIMLSCLGVSSATAQVPLVGQKTATAVAAITRQVAEQVERVAFLGVLGQKVPVNLRMDELNALGKLPKHPTIVVIKDRFFLPNGRNYTVITSSKQEAVISNLLMTEILHYINAHISGINMLPIRGAYFEISSPEVYNTMYSSFLHSISEQNLGIRQLLTLRIGLLNGTPLKEIASKLEQLQKIAEEQPLEPATATTQQLYAFHDIVLNNPIVYGAPVSSNMDGIVKQVLLDTAREKCRSLERDILTIQEQLSQTSGDAAKNLQLKQSLATTLEKYERAVQSWLFIREGIMKMTPGNTLRNQVFAIQNGTL
ncbi:MAG: hypothetical protein IKP96_04285 [Elusimicrobiaceae bacterium]|nr:hypothetical protein [Elusimicrobiaceae bacterium]